ncbi:glycosyltransferase family 2 protein [Rhodohalobacter sp. SW132]|uniref:glycosyltransferase n=1 Tax=Rhodohalobacter sp. SW132 TaxID=2293433 RepID=UPI001314AD3C|nr:glycosyltransferase family 2 protein [Rhodohalobacter sp. SW132]
MTDPSTLFWLSAFSLAYLLVTSFILLRNRLEFTSLRFEQSDSIHSDFWPKLSVCIPARNEERNIVSLLTSVCEQEYPNIELLVLDDHSTDATAQKIEKVSAEYPGRIRSVEAAEKPKNWLGKPWACHQLGKEASGDIYLFLDADTQLKPGMLTSVASAFSRHKLDMLTVWPEQITLTFWEKTIVPLIYYALLTLLPSIYVYRSPRWIPSFLQKKTDPLFAAACGQCIAFTSAGYEKTGGHESVKKQIVEDVELAKRAKRNGLKLRMFEGVGSIRCRMYRSENEIFNGLRKNFFPGFGRSVPLFIIMGLIHLIVFVLPFFLLPYSLVIAFPALLFMSVASVSIILLHRFILSVWFNWNPLYGFLHPLAVLWFQRLGIVSLMDHFTGRKVKWKGRDV